MLFLPLLWYCGYLRYELRQAKAREKKLLSREHQTSLRPEPLNPHFLFNALNTVRYFVRTDSARARDLILDLSTVLQNLLRTEAANNLTDEIEAGRAYLRLEQARAEDRLRVFDHIELAPTSQVAPSGLFLALLQNLVRGVLDRSEGGQLHLHSREGALLLEVDAVCYPESPSSSVSIKVHENKTTTVEWRY